LLALSLLANGMESGSEAGRERVAALRARLTAAQAQAVAALFDNAFPLGTLAFDALHRLPDADDAAAFVAALRALPDTAIVAHALTCAGNLAADAPRSPGVLQSLTSDPAWAAEYVRRFLSPVPAEPEAIVAAVTQPAQVRQRLARLLDDLFTTVFAPMLSSLASAAHIAEARMRTHYARDPVAFIAAHLPTTGLDASGTSRVICWPSAFLGAGWATIPLSAAGGGTVAEPGCSLAYGTETPPESVMAGVGDDGDVVPEIAPTETYQDVYRLLADPARWALIRLLVARPCYGQELSELLGLSIATVSHHLNGLKRLDLVRIEREEHRLYYHLRTDRLRALLAGAEHHLLQ
jgi:DNA-binding transcriptional ArsR family regulator